MTGYESKKAAAQDKLDSMERKALKLAQQVLESLPGFRADIDNALDAIKAALAQPAQEPDYWLGYGLQAHTEKPFEGATPLYTTPPKPVQNHSEDNLNMVAQREWVDLTDNQIEQVYYDLVKIHRGAPMPWGQIQFGKVLQAAIREANK
jgi:hypothetical protein